MIEYRAAKLADIPALMEIRGAVAENRLVHLRLESGDYVQALTLEGHGFVAEADGQLVGFACGRPVHKDIWALFVRPAYEGRGIGSALLGLTVQWLFMQGLEEIVLTTAPGTRAERLYQRKGWEDVGPAGSAERRYRLRKKPA
jgi:GNAT superfamily N-acetyltransferase